MRSFFFCLEFGLRQFFPQFHGKLNQIEANQQLPHGFGTHVRLETAVFAILFTGVAIFFLSQQLLPRFERRVSPGSITT